MPGRPSPSPSPATSGVELTSNALRHWRSVLSGQLDELEEVHRSATGTGPGRRWGTEHFNGTLYVALAGRFQQYCRDLHDEALDHLRAQGPIAAQFARQAAAGRLLDRGNPSRGSLGADFGRLGLALITDLKARRHGPSRLDRLDATIDMRNGIAHGDVTQVAAANAAGARATLSSYRRHRRALDGLTVDIADVVKHHLHTLTGAAPW